MTTRLEETPERAGSPRFPVRLAGLDVGSNAIRYSIAEFSGPETSVELETQRFSVRLGHDAFTAGVLGSAALDGAVDVAVRFRRRLDDLGVSRYRAVATSAVRESRNGGELVARVRRESGIHLETITGKEEARLVWLAVKKRVEIGESPWLLVDLGGGSIELSVIDRSGILTSDSYPLGTVRLLEDLGNHARDGSETTHLLQRIAARLSLPPNSPAAVEGVVLTGGNAEALADLIAGVAPNTEPKFIGRRNLVALRMKLASMTVEERIEKLGLREDRADVILPAAIVFERVAELTGAERLVVPKVGVRDGLLYDLAADHAEHGSHDSLLDREAVASAIALGRRYRFEESHALHVRELALSMFDQLRSLHGLDEAPRRRLDVAAILHDIGQFVSYRRHHKHSWYLISHAELSGLSAEDVAIVALVTRYHRRSEPKDYHEGYRELSGRQREEVDKLAAILRIADALDRDHRARVRRVRATENGSRVHLEITADGDISLERWAIERKAAFFERVYGLQLVIEEPVAAS